MTEKQKITHEDLKPPHIEAGGCAIVFQRHGDYIRDPDSDMAGWLTSESREALKAQDISFFRDILSQEGQEGETMFLFVASDTQYESNGYRSLETSQTALEAAVEAMQEMGINPEERILDIDRDFKLKGSEPRHKGIRPIADIREPRLFENEGYLKYLQNKYGHNIEVEVGGEMQKRGLSKEGWNAHEADLEKASREQFGAEGPPEILKRVNRYIGALRKYADRFSSRNPGKRLVIWAASHYDTISPFVKEATGIDYAQHVPVESGSGIVINIPPQQQAYFETGLKPNSKIILGNLATEGVKNK